MKFNPIPAVETLKNALYVVNTNAPINDKEGRKGMAELERKNAKSFKWAIDALGKLRKEK